MDRTWLRQAGIVKIGGLWVGYGLGDDFPRVRDIKRHVLRKFAWVRAWSPPLDDSTVFDATLGEVTVEMQRRYGLPQTGIWDYRTQLRAGLIPPKPVPPRIRPLLFSVCGTGVPWWVGPDADTARAVEDRYRWQPIGYAAQPFPMRRSVEAGKAELVAQIERWRPDIERAGTPSALVGYSQGAIVIAEVWEDFIRPDDGRLAWFRPYLGRAVAFGNPMREQGHGVGDGNGQAPAPDSHGIADRLMDGTPDWWLNIAHRGDIYTDCTGQQGEWMTAIYKIVMGAKIFQGPDSLLAQAVEAINAPAPEIVAAFRAIIGAGMFFGAKTMWHINYRTETAVNHLRSSNVDQSAILA